MEDSHSKVTVPEIHSESHTYKHLLEDIAHCQVHWDMGYRALTAVDLQICEAQEHGHTNEGHGIYFYVLYLQTILRDTWMTVTRKGLQ